MASKSNNVSWITPFLRFGCGIAALVMLCGVFYLVTADNVAYLFLVRDYLLRRSATLTPTPGNAENTPEVAETLQPPGPEIIRSTIEPCAALFPESERSDQANFRGIYPGVSTSMEVTELLGPPLESHRSFDSVQWLYPAVSIFFHEDIVKIIQHFLSLEESILTAGEILAEYGCPDHFFAIDEAQHPSGSFFLVSFVYLNGIEFIFDGYPINLNEAAKFSLVFQQTSLETYLEDNIRFGDPKYAAQITWQNAITPSNGD